MDESEGNCRVSLAPEIREEEMEVATTTQLENVTVTPDSTNILAGTDTQSEDSHTASTAAGPTVEGLCTSQMDKPEGNSQESPEIREEEMEVSMTTHPESVRVTSDSHIMSAETDTQTASTAAELDVVAVCKVEGSEKDDSDDSDSDSSTSSSSSSSSSLSGRLSGNDDDDEGFSQPAPIKCRDEVLLEELPAVEEVTVMLPEEAELQPAGTVSSVIQQLVVVQSLKDTPALTDESILFRSDRLALAKVFEVFGPVSSPLYILRFSSVEQIKSKGLTEGLMVYYAPAIKEYTGYILVQQLRLFKGSDASWKNDQEPPPEALDFSDDDEEQEAKRKVKNSRRRRDDDNTNNPDHVTQKPLQQQRHTRLPFRRSKHLPLRHAPPPPPPPVYLPPPCPYPPPLPPHTLPPPSFPLYPPPPFFNPSFSRPYWPPNSFPDLLPPPPPPPPPPSQ